MSILKLPNLITVASDSRFSGVASCAFGVNSLQNAFGAPAPGAPGTDVVSRFPDPDTNMTSSPAIGIFSPGFGTVTLTCSRVGSQLRKPVLRFGWFSTVYAP